ncbi:MAG: LacI family DNA-binding transcriptional regulator [Kiritimatiellae bacterium]|nr:LacI family DNA-binding transcriptional regulator [Kiritimatiellia bacterium]
MRKRATLKDVAKRSGVDPTTASKILNRRPDCYASAATKEKVLESARALDYIPNVYGKLLKGGKTRTIALLTRYAREEDTLATALQMVRLVHEKGYRTLFHQLPFHVPDVLALIDDLIARQVEGFIFLKGHEPAVDERVGRLVEEGYPVLAVDGYFDFPVDRVMGDRFEAGRLVTEHLLACGARRIVMICSDPSNRSVEPRVAGYRQALEARGLAFDERLLVGDAHSYRQAADAMRRRLADGEAPDGVFGYNNETAIGAMCALSEAGLRVPGDVVVAAFDDMQVAGYLPGCSLTTVYFPWQTMAREAVKMLFAGLAREGKPGRFRKKTISPVLTARQSTARPAAPGAS